MDANVQITPPTATNPIGTDHVLTGHVNVNDGSGAGFVNAPAGTTINFTILSGPGAFDGPSSCLTVLATGSCTVQITSNVSGTTVVRASTTVSVGGVSLTRATGDAHVGDSADAQKTWVGARISIAPNATNEVGQPHTFTVTLEKDTGSGSGPAPGEHVDVTLTDTNGATHTAPTGTCTNAGPNTDASGQCTITFTSPTPGKVTGTATSTLSVNGASVTVSTDGNAPNSGPAVKTFVDANIQITPPTATNSVVANHVLTGHVNVNDGSGFVNAPDGTQITFTILSGPGSFITTNPCTTSGGTGSCQITLASATPGTTVVRASTTVSVGGVSLTRSSGDGKTGDSVDASKDWADDVVATHVRDAANNDITNQTVNTGTVVHDEATVTKATGTPASVPDPTGTVSFTLFDNGTCNGNVVATDPNKPLVSGTATSATLATPTSGTFSYLAHYNGDANYPAHDGPCEPFTVNSAPVGSCHETINPAGQPNKHTDNGFPDDPFGGHAVPGGKSTSPGVNGNGPINSDGFYLVSGNLFSDTTVIDFPGPGVAWPDNTTVKYTQRPGNPNITITAMAGPNSVITYQIQAPGDLYAGAAKGDPAAVFCGVPPPPF